MDTETATKAARLALEGRDFPAAIRTFESELAHQQPGAQAHALVGLAYFQSALYERAAHHYGQALADEPENFEWREMHALAQANAQARVDQHLPELSYFDRAALLAPPEEAAKALPRPLPPQPSKGLWGRVAHIVGNELGEVITLFFRIVETLLGKLLGYRDRVWTNWYRRPLQLGIMTLAYMRELLNKNNLGSSYPPGSKVGFLGAMPKPPDGVMAFRTADGSWNNLDDPKEGAAGTRFLRNVAPSAVRPEVGAQLLTPNPREISLKLFSRPLDPVTGEAKMQEVPFLNMIAGAWIQFMNSDWINHGEIVYNDLIEVPLPADDPARKRYWQTKMFIGKTQADPTRMPGQETLVQSAINEVTHWWDGSQIYGSDQSTQDRLRSHVGGKMRLQDNGLLPTDSKGVEESGFMRNWWVGMAMLHTLFVREHNAICEHLSETYPDWDDNTLFNVARLINAAGMAKIHTLEWTPAILPNAKLLKGVGWNWYGGLTSIFHRGKARKVLRGIKIENAELGGVVGNPINKHGAGFGLTEEFTEIYRLHSLLPEKLDLRRRHAADDVDSVPFNKTRQSASAKITSRYSMADLFYSFGNQHPGQLVLNNYPRFMQQLSIPGIPFFDMGTVDIVRARERGVPRYNEFRRQLGLNPISKFEDLTDNAEHLRCLKELYGSDPADVEKLDLLVGTLGEGPANRPSGFGFGETMFSIFLLNATRRLQADRFFTDSYNADTYTPEGLAWIDDVDMKTVILRHYPELADSGLANISNAFEPWDTDATLAKDRHPLRGFDPAITGDRWRGEAFPQNAHSEKR